MNQDSPSPSTFPTLSPTAEVASESVALNGALLVLLFVGAGLVGLTFITCISAFTYHKVLKKLLARFRETSASASSFEVAEAAVVPYNTGRNNTICQDNICRFQLDHIDIELAEASSEPIVSSCHIFSQTDLPNEHREYPALATGPNVVALQQHRPDTTSNHPLFNEIYTVSVLPAENLNHNRRPFFANHISDWLINRCDTRSGSTATESAQHAATTMRSRHIIATAPTQAETQGAQTQVELVPSSAVTAAVVGMPLLHAESAVLGSPQMGSAADTRGPYTHGSHSTQQGSGSTGVNSEIRSHYTRFLITMPRFGSNLGPFSF